MAAKGKMLQKGKGGMRMVPVDESSASPFTLPEPSWIPDAQCQSCVQCQGKFDFLNRRHHCRRCGKCFCDACSSAKVALPRMLYVDPVRHCAGCTGVSKKENDFFEKHVKALLAGGAFSVNQTGETNDNDTVFTCKLSPDHRHLHFENEHRRLDDIGMTEIDSLQIWTEEKDSDEMDLFWSSLPGIPEKSLPEPSDLVDLQNHIKKEIKELNLNDSSPEAYRRTCVLAEARLLLYNKRRAGEVEGIGVKEYVKRHRGVSNIERSMRSELTALEEKLLESQELLETRGKYGRGVPVIIPSDARDILLYLASSGNRTNAGIRPSNRYLFPNSCNPLASGMAMKYKDSCGEMQLVKMVVAGQNKRQGQCWVASMQKAFKMIHDSRTSIR